MIRITRILLPVLALSISLPALAYDAQKKKPAAPAAHAHGAAATPDANSVPPSTEKLPKEAKVFFKNLKDGQEIGQTFKVEFGVAGMKVMPAGQLIPGTGHHHLMINADDVARGMVIPADDKHIHFGQGQTEHELKLAPGKYKLTLQFADGAHLSYGKQLSATVNVTVK